MSDKLLKRSLTGRLGWVTRAIKDCEETVSGTVLTYDSLKVNIDVLKNRWARYEEVYTKLEDNLIQGEKDSQFEVENAAYEENLNDYVAKLKEFEKTLEDVRRGASLPNIASNPPKFQLPVLTLPEFNGESSWVSFWDKFKSLVHDRSDLTGVNKLTYLMGQLKGAAYDLISELTISNANYGVAVQILKDNYEDEKLALKNLTHKLIDLPGPGHNLKELQAFRISLSCTLKAIGTNNNLEAASWLLDNMIQKKLHQKTCDELYHKYKKHYFSYKEIEVGLLDICKQLQATKKETAAVKTKEPDKGPTTKVKSNNFGKAAWKEEVGTYTTSINDTAKTPTYLSSKPTPQISKETGTKPKGQVEQGSRTCRFCKENHSSIYCKNYPDYLTRLKRLDELKYCMICLSSNHNSTECSTKLNTCYRCKVHQHHAALCQGLKNGEELQSKTTNVSVAITKPPNAVNSPAAVPTAEVKLVHDNQTRIVKTLFDTGAQKSFISRDTVCALKLPTVGKVRLAITGFLSNQEPQMFELVKPLVQLGKFKCRITAAVLENMNTQITTRGLKETSEYLNSKCVKLADSFTSDVIGPIQFIIGSDYCGKFMHRMTKKHGVQLITSAGGHLIMGPLPFGGTVSSKVNVIEPVFVTPAQSLIVARIGTTIDPTQIVEVIEENTEPIHKLWDLDTIGINEEECTPEEQIAQEHFLDTLEYKDGQYWVGLPWKLNAPELPTNYKAAKGQVNTLVHKLRQKPDQLEVYHTIIKDQLKSGFIEQVPEVAYKPVGHYLPHHAVAKDSITTPLRVVFNCSSRAAKTLPSLNDCLYTGPNMTEKIGDVLINYRTKKYALVADISKAFLRIGLKEGDRDFTRFLWPENPKDPGSPLKTYRFKAVLFGSCSSPFLLCSTLKYHFDKNQAGDIGQAFYMDNLQATIESEKEALYFYQRANLECKTANLPLQSWNSNSKLMRDTIKKDYPDSDMPNQQMVLGLEWDIENDRMSMKTPLFPKVVLTKRSLLSQISMLYDPLGLLSPITIKGKCLLQEVWREEVSWDTPLDDKYVKEWDKLKEDYILSTQVSIPRRFDDCDNTDPKLHVFCDASAKAYGAAAYYVAGSQCRLIMAKTRVAPLKGRTLPQLELTALEVGTRLANYLEKIITTFKETIIWTDSEICLHWITKNESPIPYVRNRVGKILELRSDFVFKHVTSKDNPADLLSRGTTVQKLMKDWLWFNGPEWVTDISKWPIQKSYEKSAEVDKVYMDPVMIPNQSIIEIENFSSLEKLLNVTKVVFNFLKKRVAMDMSDPLKYWIKQTQRVNFTEEIRLLSERGSKMNKIIKDLGLFLDDEEIIRCRGRIGKADLPLVTRYPVLLPKKCHLTKLIVESAHQNTLHGGMAETLAYIRKTYWIPKGRQAVKQYIKSCQVCRRYEAKTMPYPGPPALPSDRVKGRVPFEVTGVDYTGALTITGDGPPKKAYICLFTCATTRAVHLEVAEDLSSETFLQVFRRFAARRSCPRRLISDNGTNFVGAAPIILEILNDPKVQRALGARNCVWSFTTPRAPWKNGFTERMIGVVKSCLRKTLHRVKLTLEELKTVIVEIETRTNNRPLTYIDDTSFSIEALTPSHLIHGRRIEPFPCINVQDELEDPTVDDTAQHLREKYHLLNTVLKAWDKHWEYEYLVSLRERYYGAQPASNKQLLKEGEVVLLQTDQSRSQWPLAKVISVHPDKEGVLRVVKVMSKGQTSLRTIDKLIPLELAQIPAAENEQAAAAVDAAAGSTARPARAAALSSQRNWRDLLSGGHIT